MSRFKIVCVLVSALFAIPASNADATVSTDPIAAGLSRPIGLTYVPGDSDRVFVVEQTGQIRIIKNDVIQTEPFLDLTTAVACCGERGLLGLAFHPNYQSNGFFFVDYTRASDGATVIARYTISGANADSADETSEVILRTISQPESNHNGGCLQFGPDGMLYVGMGDGGGANDQHGLIGNGQNPLILLGKILRFDVDNPPTYLPVDNPWIGVQAVEDTLDEIWAMGVRNPWRFSFDRLTGDLYIGDVGQGAREEIDVQPVTSIGGENYGWRCMEGTSCTGMTGCTCNAAALTLPVYEYTHGSGRCSITGGFVSRDCAVPELYGAYLFGDYCSNQIWSITYDGSSVIDTTEWTTQLSGGVSGLVSFGEDAAGHIYICSLDGDVFRIISDQSNCEGGCMCPFQADFDASGALDALDLNEEIDVLFFGATDTQDPMCPATRADFNNDGVPDALDLNDLIDHLFFGGPPPVDPCSP